MDQNTEPLAPPRIRPIAEAPAAARRAVELLRNGNGQLGLTEAEASQVVAHMHLVSVAKGTTLFREGDGTKLDHLLLLLEGEVSIDTWATTLAGPVAISVVGPGSIIGEMALLDGAPRSASCVTASPVQAAVLSRKGLEVLIDEHPRTAVKLLVGLGARTADRLRALGEQLQIYATLVDDLQAEVARLRGKPPALR
jgi:CRP-like cAMP-binding protein